MRPCRCCSSCWSAASSMSSLRVRASGEAQNLLSLQSGIATLIEADGSAARFRRMRCVPGDRMLVAAGERVAADGVVLSGSGEIDQSLITGETAPVTVAAGSANLCRHAQSHAAARRSRYRRRQRDAARRDRPADGCGRAGQSALPPARRPRRANLCAGRAWARAATFLGWLVVGAPWQTALTYAIAVLIITCPCALALAVPAVQIAAASRLFRQGIMVKAADGLERIAEADMVVFDKTGTLTLGRPSCSSMMRLFRTRRSRRAAALAAASQHPYAQAIVAAARNRRIGRGRRRRASRRHRARPHAHFALRRGAAWVCRMVRHCPRPRRGERGLVSRGIGGRRFASVSPTRCAAMRLRSSRS